VKDTKTLATNLHNITPWVQAVLANNESDHDSAGLKKMFSELEVPLIILDRDSNFVYNPMRDLGKVSYRFTFVNTNPALYSQTVNPRELRFALSDYIELTFSQDIGTKPLPIASKIPDEPLYVVGFPGPTSVFAALGGKDADGMRQMVSKGSKIAFDERVSLGSQLIREKFFLRIDAPAYVGNSGGPVLTADGKVAGILNAGMLTQQPDGKPIKFAELIRLQDLDGLRAAWEK
jgi:hypothetical protein